MPETFPRLTLFLGPPTRHGRALNDIVRTFRDAMISAGLDAHQNWVAMKRLRAVAEAPHGMAQPLRREAPAFYSAMGFLDSARKGLRNAELFPNAMNQLAGIAVAAEHGPLRIVFAPDPIPDLFMAEGAAGVDEAVRTTPWEDLYELSWIDLVESVRASFPGAEILALTHRGMALGGSGLRRRLFGPAAGAVDARSFLREALTTTGRAVLGRIESDETPDEAVAGELYDSFALRFGPDECRDRLGLDRLTLKLLSQRFDEDIARMRGTSGVEVI